MHLPNTLCYLFVFLYHFMSVLSKFQPKILFNHEQLEYTENFLDTNQSSAIPAVPGLPGTEGILQPLEQLVLQSFNNWRSVMVKGSGTNGIPILDPFVVPIDIPISFPNPINEQLGNYKLILSKLTFAGLSTFTFKTIDVEPTSMKFEIYIGNMSASCGYTLNYYFSTYLPVPIQICTGSAYGAIYGADILGSGELFPNPGNWFKLLQLFMTFGFDNLDIRIYPTFPIVNPSTQQQIENTIYNGIQAMKPNISALTQMTYTKTVELKLS